ncbi:hypothetical protein EII34_01960 [Arachnia propionica]|uniref:Uncharacterized protein n=1 Tax=Arachnia propionica TaxID=1750 RepID=A0A3P1TCU3_9ACTN|nr:hypothetical protein [Arachnia propionica]RRD07272.1 hypothetical protein EII34_01960 [Arachnia propionica]
MRIPREDFLRRTLKEHCTSAEIDAAAATTPAQAGLSPALIEKLAKQAVRSESTRASAFSAATGLPGGFALLGMVPPDVAQNLAHVLRVSQKLAYLHGWPDFFDGDEFDETTKGILTLFSGVMFGAYGATQGISNLLANRVASEWPKRALSQGVLYPVVNRIATQLGLRMSKEAFARGVSKVVPVLGGLVSGGFTMATFWPMASRLRRHLAGLELAQPSPGQT